MSTPILQEQQPPSTDQLLEKLIDHIDRLTEAKRQPIKSVSLKEASRMLGISDYHVTRRLIDQGALRPPCGTQGPRQRAEHQRVARRQGDAMTSIEWLRALTTAALALLIIISLIWWINALTNGIFALTPFITMMTGITIAGILTDREHSR